MELKLLADRAAVQIAAYPGLTGKEKLKRFIKKGILRQALPPVDPFSWPNAMLGQGLLAAFEATQDPACLTAVLEHLKRWKRAGYPIHSVDNMMNGSLALWTEELLLEKKSRGDAARDANAAERSDPAQHSDPAQSSDANAAQNIDVKEMLTLCREAQEACATWIQGAVRTQQGLLPYRVWHPDWLFADTLGMICPFLCRYGAAQGEEAFLKLGTAQLIGFLENGMDPVSNLPYHGYDEKSGMKYGIIGWGRACGWMLKGLAESLPYIPRDREEYGILQNGFWRLAESVCRYQRPDGGFSWQLEALEGHRDTSTEGMIGSALVRGLRAADAPAVYEKRLARLAGALEQSVSAGTVRDCLGECRGFAEYPQSYGTYPWGSGSALELFAVMEKLISR